MFYDTQTILAIVKSRLNRLDSSLDDYLTKRIEGAAAELVKTGITVTEEPDDAVLLADYTVWRYQNRDSPGGMPEWLRLARRERWLKQTHDT